MSYSFVPAAVNCMYSYGIGVYVKYHKETVSSKLHPKIVVKQDNHKYTWLSCPDRELVMVKNSYPQFYPMGENFDEYLDLNIFNDEVCSALDIDIYMLNYSAYGTKGGNSPRARRNGRNPNSKMQPNILADSGGFQLYSGAKDFIDPKDVIDWYNDNVDWGMVLDVPPILSEEDILYKSAVMQKNNIKVMLEHKKPEVELINIIQGWTFDQRMKFLDIVDFPEIDRLAFGGYRGSPVSEIAAILQLTNGPRRFKHYHILGVYNLLKLPAIIKVANLKGAPFFTSDATTPIQSAINKRYHHQSSIFDPERRIDIGRNSAVNEFNYLPCSCPVCHIVKYMSIFSVLESQLVSNLLTLHNIYEIKRYTKMMDSLAANLTDKEYKDVVKHQLKRRGEGTLAALDLIATYNDDPKKALKRYAMFFPKGEVGLFPTGNGDGLFGEGRDAMVGEDKHLFIKGKKETDDEKRIRFAKTVKKYSAIHGNMDKKKKKKSKNLKEK